MREHKRNATLWEMVANRENDSTQDRHVKSEHQYAIYLLRLWCDVESKQWRVALTNPHTHDEWLFADVDSLIRYLQERFATDSVPDAENSHCGNVTRNVLPRPAIESTVTLPPCASA